MLLRIEILVLIVQDTSHITLHPTTHPSRRIYAALYNRDLGRFPGRRGSYSRSNDPFQVRQKRQLHMQACRSEYTLLEHWLLNLFQLYARHRDVDCYSDCLDRTLVLHVLSLLCYRVCGRILGSQSRQKSASGRSSPGARPEVAVLASELGQQG